MQSNFGDIALTALTNDAITELEGFYTEFRQEYADNFANIDITADLDDDDETRQLLPSMLRFSWRMLGQTNELDGKGWSLLPLSKDQI
ncbi:hypothetical protein DFQ30_005824, partial [Apophysomyces sp. BC1015]